MRKIYFEQIDKVIILDKNITRVVFEDCLLYRDVAININESLVYSYNDIVENIERKALVLFNPFQLNINDPKIIKALYKKLENTIKINLNEKLTSIESKILDLFDELTYDDIVPIIYENEVVLNKLFTSFDVRYLESKDYLEKVIHYFKVYHELYDNDIIISFGLLNLLNQQEKEVLRQELKILNLNLVDLMFSDKIIENDLIIDNEWCIM